MTNHKQPWWAHVAMATILAAGFAAAIFWINGLPIEIAESIAMAIITVTIAVYVWVMRKK
jgi:hypothetical protein